LDLHESGIIGKPFKRTSTAKGFEFINFSLKYFKRLQSPEPLHAELNPILLLVRITVCMCSSRDLFRQTVFHKCGRGINCSLGCSLHPSFRNPQQNRAPLWWIFYQITVRQPIGRQDSMQPVIRTSRRLGSILHEAAQNFEVVSNIQH
jgi:hypothetical protein